nr:hypothetical protein [uncultured Brevundimonas sp.]
MGREALVYAEVGEQVGEAKALLESNELILRGEVRRRYPRPELENVRVAGDALHFRCLGEEVRLELGAQVAESWRLAIATPPPTLRFKLGLNNGATAFLVGKTADAELCDALTGVMIDDATAAKMIIACVDEVADLENALSAAALNPLLPIWMVYRKGRGVTVGDGAIRESLRSAGLRDTKSCSVSDSYTATRYNRAGDAR